MNVDRYKNLLVKIAFLSIIFISVLVLILNLFYSRDSDINQPPPEKPTDNKLTIIEDKYNQLTLPEKQGMLMMISIPDTVLSDGTVQFLRDNYIDGIIIMKNNAVSESQLKQLTSDLKTRVRPDLFIAVDQEGGSVVRIPWDKYANVSARQIGDTNDLDYAYQIANYRAKLLLELGINTILGPVADIGYDDTSFMYDRSYGSDPEKVAKFVEITVKAQHDAGIITVLKHFPGHGNTEIDSHYSLPVIEMTKEELLSSELIPFKRGIDAGAEMVMFGHIFNPIIDNQKPATNSRIFEMILYEDLEFKGLIITDDLKMAGNKSEAIGWGINISIEDFSQVIKRINTIQPDDKYIKNILLFKEEYFK